MASGGEQDSGWWLPEDFSVHGPSIDHLFIAIFWLTMVTFVAVWVVMGYFLIKYRHRSDRRKAHFTHGNTRLEMVWTLIPAIILIFLALVTKRVWDNYRYSPVDRDPNLCRILVVGQQFKWNVVYPGPDGKLGRYLVFPKTTDLTWPIDPPGADKYDWPKDPQTDKPYPGPAFAPPEEARKAINAWIDQRNPLGKDMTDEAGKDDDWQGALSRPVFVPKGRPVEVTLSSKDVIHDFFLPNYRVKLDAVPGMRGLLYFTATKSSAELEAKSRREYSADELVRLMAQKGAPDYKLVVPADAPNVDVVDGVHRYYREVKKTKTSKGKKIEVTAHETVARDQDFITPDLLNDLKSIGVTKVQAFVPKVWDLVCEELCGAGHTTMRGQLIVLEPEEFHKRFEAAPAAAADATDRAVQPTTAPSGGGGNAVAASAAALKP